MHWFKQINEHLQRMINQHWPEFAVCRSQWLIELLCRFIQYIFMCSHCVNNMKFMECALWLNNTEWLWGEHGGFFFFMHSAPRPSCGSNGMQMVPRGWPTGGRHRSLRPAGSVLKLVHHITVPNMPYAGATEYSCARRCVWVWLGKILCQTTKSEKNEQIQVSHCMDQCYLSIQNSIWWHRNILNHEFWFYILLMTL